MQFHQFYLHIFSELQIIRFHFDHIELIKVDENKASLPHTKDRSPWGSRSDFHDSLLSIYTGKLLTGTMKNLWSCCSS